MGGRSGALVVVVGCCSALAAQHAAAQQSAVLPQIKALHLQVIAPAANVPESCRTYAGVFGGQFADGPYANLVIMTVAKGPTGCVFHGMYGWSAYAKDPNPGTVDVGPGTRLESKIVDGNLKLGDPSQAALVVHPDLRADFYMQGKLISHAALKRLPPAALQ